MTGFIGSKKTSLVYLNVPKVGCTSIKNWLYYKEYGEYLKDPLTIHEKERDVLPHFWGSRAEIEALFQKSFVFTFVRHPLKRAYSTFVEKIWDQGPYHFPHARNLLIQYFGARLARNPNLEDFQRDFLTFLHFVRATQLEKVEFRFDWHWAPQSVVIKDAVRQRSIDFIGRIETLADDFSFVCSKVGLQGEELPRFNEGPKAPYSYDEIVSEEILSLGRTIYAEDMRNFSYQF